MPWNRKQGHDTRCPSAIGGYYPVRTMVSRSSLAAPMYATSSTVSAASWRRISSATPSRRRNQVPDGIFTRIDRNPWTKFENVRGGTSSSTSITREALAGSPPRARAAASRRAGCPCSGGCRTRTTGAVRGRARSMRNSSASVDGRLVAVGRQVPHHDLVALADRLAAELGVGASRCGACGPAASASG